PARLVSRLSRPVLDLLCDLMGKVPARCAYAEARHVAGDSEDLAIRNGQIDDIASSSSEGIGVRVRLGGAWGFAATRDVSAAGAGIAAYAAADGELQVRSYPLAHGGDFRAAGWEHVVELALAANAPRVAAEALDLLTAPECPAGIRTVVLHGEQLALQTHESIG